MGKTGQYIHRIVKTVDQDFGNAYATDKLLTVNLNQDIVGENPRNNVFKKDYYSGNIQLVRFKGTIVSGTPTQITFKGYEDTNGTKLLLPPSTSTLEVGLDGTTYGASFLVNCYHSSASDDLVLFLKTNTGEFNVNEVQCTWFE